MDSEEVNEEVIEEVIVLDYRQTSFIDRFQPSSITNISTKKKLTLRRLTQLTKVRVVDSHISLAIGPRSACITKHKHRIANGTIEILTDIDLTFIALRTAL